MTNLIVTTPFIKEVKEMRKAIVENLIDLMKKHNVNEVYCTEFNNCPVIHIGIYDEDVTFLNTIEYVNGEWCKYILFNGSNGVVNASSMDIELLVEVYNWIMDYEDELFINKE